MFIIRWWRFFRGFVVISLEGRGVERLLNLAVARGIGFWDLQKQKHEARLSVSLASFRALRPLVRKARCRLHIRRKVGLPFIKLGCAAAGAWWQGAFLCCGPFPGHLRSLACPGQWDQTSEKKNAGPG